MSYCTQQNMIDRFGETELIQLTSRDGYQKIDTTILNQSIADADAEINGFLTAYSLPLANIPANMVRIACDISRYYLYSDQCVETVTQRYKDAIGYLKMVANGTINLAPDTAGQAISGATATVSFTSSESVFARADY